jgi:FkbM family methyltransferase
LIVDTRRLFTKLLRTLDIGTVCDVGSMDGTDALRFRRALPSANVIALEPNPRNWVLMQADTRLRRGRIRILPLAASDLEADAPFFVVAADYVRNRDLPRRGISSLYRRSDGPPLAEIVSVRTVRLDRLLSAENCADAPIALWIDTEGMAFETVSGASGVLDRTRMVHVEVETLPCIGADQRLFSDVERLLLETGFALVATDQPRTSMQLNALFVRADLLLTKRNEIRWHAADARLRRRMKRALLPLLPRRVRRFLSRHANAVRT